MRSIQHRHTTAGTSYVVRFKDAERRERSETFKVEAKAIEFAALLDALGPERAIAFLDAQNPAAPAAWTLDRWAAEYIATLTDVTDGTRARYTSIYTRVWAPTLGPLPLTAVDKKSIADVINSLAAAGVADKTIANAHGLLAGMLAAAVVENPPKLDRNPCAGIKLPKRTGHWKVRPRFLEHAQFEVLYENISPHYQPLVLFLVGTGARWGEAAALLISDLELDAPVPVVHITKAVKWGGTRGMVGPPKTPAGHRDVSLPADVVEALRPLVAGRRRTERLFLAPRGGELQHRTFHADIWRPAIWRAQHCPKHTPARCLCGTAHYERCAIHRGQPPDPCGCEGTLTMTPPRIHDLRHTHAAWLIEEGVSLSIIRDRLGHESIQTTEDVYGGLLHGFQATAADAANTAFRKRKRSHLRVVDSQAGAG